MVKIWFLVLVVFLHACSEIGGVAEYDEKIEGYVVEGGTANGESAVNVTMGDFEESEDAFDRGQWTSAIEIFNPEESLIIISGEGSAQGKNNSWGLSSRPFESDKKSVDFNLKNSLLEDLGSLDIKYSVSIFECKNLDPSVSEAMCINGSSEYFGRPWVFLQKREDQGLAVEPTIKVNYYFNFSSIESPPTRITKNEFEAAR